MMTSSLVAMNRPAREMQHGDAQMVLPLRR